MKTTTETPRDEFAALCSAGLGHPDPRPRQLPRRRLTPLRRRPPRRRAAHRAHRHGKADIAALVVWKRLSAQTRWVTALMSLPDTHIRAVTEQAVTAARDTLGLPLHPHTGTLRPLPPTPRRPPPTRLSTHRRLECTRHRHHPVLDRRQPAPAGTGIGPPAQAMTTQQAADQHKPAPAL
ncbi:hypothetical protein ACQ4WX_02675 [Streptomyces lasalocidi]